MLFKTKGVVLHTLNYSENSIIIKAYTENDGLQSFIVKTGRSKKSPIKSGLFQPLSVLCMESYQSKNQGLHHIKEVSVAVQLMNIYYDTRKSAIAFFIAELLLSSIREEEKNKSLFDFIFNSIITLDQKEKSVSDFHLFFLIDLTRFLGFFPNNNYSDKSQIFDLNEGCFQEYIPEHSHYIKNELSQYLHFMIEENRREELKLSSTFRKEMIKKLLEYYSIHLNGFKKLRSHIVLEDVFI